MVVNNRQAQLVDLELGHLAFFLGRKMNELVVEQLHDAGYAEFRESHGYTLQHFIEGDHSVTELAVRMEVSQQAASKFVAELVRLGALEAAPAGDRRSRRVRLSESGRRLISRTRTIRKNLERILRETLGTEVYETAQQAMLLGLKTLGGIDQVETRRLKPPQ